MVYAFVFQLNTSPYVLYSHIYSELSCNQTSASTDAPIELYSPAVVTRERKESCPLYRKKNSFEGDNNIAECIRGHSPAGKMANGGLHCWDSIGRECDVYFCPTGIKLLSGDMKARGMFHLTTLSVAI
jgi:hypothetical protein